MGIVVDFGDGLEHMLDELEETYNGRILSPQGKVIRVMPVIVRREEESGSWMFHGHVHVSTIFGDEIYQALMQTVPIVSMCGLEEKEREAREDLEKLVGEVERKIRERGFIIRRGRYQFREESRPIS